jgi:hypothetical protein
MNAQLRVNTNPRKLDTAEFADALRIKPQTIRRSLCLNGHYLGIKPAAKLPNGRLLWDAAEVEALTSGEVAK